MAEHVYKNNDTWSIEQSSIAPQWDYNREPKYVVKNCPAYLGADCVGFGNGGCSICTDCPIKRVIEEVKWEIKAIPNENNRGDLAERILSMFEIESEV